MYSLYEGNRNSRVLLRIAEGEHNVLGDMMNMLRHRPIAKGQERPFYQLYSGFRLHSSTY